MPTAEMEDTVGGAGLRGKSWSLVLDVLGFRGFSDSQVGGIMEMVAYIHLEFRGGALAGIINLGDIND